MSWRLKIGRKKTPEGFEDIEEALDQFDEQMKVRDVVWSMAVQVPARTNGAERESKSDVDNSPSEKKKTVQLFF